MMFFEMLTASFPHLRHTHPGIFGVTFHGGRFTKPVMCPIKGVCIPLTGYNIRYFITNLQEPRIPLEWGKNNKSIQTICLCVYRYIIANRVSQKMVLLTLHLHAQQNHIRYYYSLRFSF